MRRLSGGRVWMPIQPDSDISAYTYERTLLMEQRHAMLAQMKIKKKNSLTVNVSSTRTCPAGAIG